MKFSRIILATLISVVSLVACKKDRNNAPTPPTQTIEGRWVGTYVNSSSGSSFYYSFNIKTGGVIEELNASGQKLGSGTWTMSNNVLSAHYVWPSGSASGFSILAAYNKAQAKLVGNWGYGASTTDGGTWQMTKSN